jgi:hypothetical protein
MSKIVFGRYLKPRWVVDGFATADAFGLRPGPPKEGYVSIYRSNGSSNDQRFESVLNLVTHPKFTPGSNGFIGLFDPENALSSVNTGKKNVIEFKDEGEPHFGVHFLTDNDVEILEAQTALAFSIGYNIKKVSDISGKSKVSSIKELDQLEK